ncbi:SigE family RNA polymerase sigma factor [Kribbella qitaiheensis]|uniref:SigE family RNA polymerase sigma factor n=1 Tax=Kribbella qitaiheensis TaxID=1544730 RepID=UPI00361F413D
MKAADERGFREFVSSRRPALLRTAYLLCGDWHRAEDVVSTAIVKLYVAWRRVACADNPDAYARQVVVRTWLDEARRPWRRELPVEMLPDRPLDHTDTAADATVRRADLRLLLAKMPARQRAVLVLRFYDDLSVERTAEILGCTRGAVMTLTSRALETIRGLLPDGAMTATDLEETL